jgi:hypothetical protein
MRISFGHTLLVLLGGDLEHGQDAIPDSRQAFYGHD